MVGDVPQGISPSQSDRRIEAVLVFLSGRIGTKLHKLSSIREIQRGFDGKPTGLTEVKLPKSGKNSAEIGGLFSELMPKDVPSRENRVIAQVALERFGILKPA